MGAGEVEIERCSSKVSFSAFLHSREDEEVWVAVSFEVFGNEANEYGKSRRARKERRR